MLTIRRAARAFLTPARRAQLNPFKCQHCPFDVTPLAFVGEKANDLFGFLAHDDKAKELVLVFRGTINIKNWLINLQSVGKEAYDGAPAGTAAANGFVKAWNLVRPSVLTAMEAARKKYPKEPVVFVGHSLGGAIANLAASYFVGKKIVPASKASLYTFGQPRVGDEAWAKWFNSLGLKASFRVCNNADVVCHGEALRCDRDRTPCT
jgi:hypothetical protein